jgi:hypothetical protein
MVEILFVFCHILGVIIFVPLLALSPKREGGSPLVEFYNAGGWSTIGLATMVGTLSPTSALIGFDCSVHMGMLALDPICFSDLHYSRGSQRLLSHCTDHPSHWICRQCYPWILGSHDLVS